MTSSAQVKKKSYNEKEIMDFFRVIEDRFKNDESKIKEFSEIINQESNTK